MALSLDLVKQHLRLPAAAGSEDALLAAYVATAEAEFLTESKRRYPKAGEPTDPDTGAYLDEAVLSDGEQAIAQQWTLLAVAHWYENRQPVVVGVNIAQVPLTCERLMNLLRCPTL